LLNRLVLETFENKKYKIPCYAGNISGVMYPEGDVYPCELLGKEHKIGNIRDFELDFKIINEDPFDISDIKQAFFNLRKVF